VALVLHAGEPANGRLSAGCTPLFQAAEKGDTAVATVLLAARGCGISTEGMGETVLMAAAKGGHVPMIELLLAAGADVHARTRMSSTALNYAVPHGHAEAAAALLRAAQTALVLLCTKAPGPRGMRARADGVLPPRGTCPSGFRNVI
jgi:ankyrin repeat protein